MKMMSRREPVIWMPARCSSAKMTQKGDKEDGVAMKRRELLKGVASSLSLPLFSICLLGTNDTVGVGVIGCGGDGSRTHRDLAAGG